MTTEGPDGQTIRTARVSYPEWSTLSRDGEVLAELYDLAQDPIELLSIVNEPAYVELIVEPSGRLATARQGELLPS